MAEETGAVLGWFPIPYSIAGRMLEARVVKSEGVWLRFEGYPEDGGLLATWGQMIEFTWGTSFVIYHGQPGDPELEPPHDDIDR